MNYTNPNYGNPNYYTPQGMLTANTPTYGYVNQYSGPQAVPQYQQPAAIRGRVVKDQSEILPNEIPMDGTISFFPKADGTEIYGKAWTSNGTIQNFKFVKVEENQNGSVSTPSTEDLILEKLNKIENVLYNRQNPKQNTPNQKKEV